MTEGQTDSEIGRLTDKKTDRLKQTCMVRKIAYLIRDIRDTERESDRERKNREIEREKTERGRVKNNRERKSEREKKERRGREKERKEG